MDKITKLMRIENQWKYKTIKDAEKEAEAVQAFTKRIAKRNNWACKAMIVVSEHSLKNCAPVIEKNSNKGRPKRIFLPKNKIIGIKKKQPHLHILVYANPAETITSQIVRNINERHRRKYTYCKKRTISRKKPVTDDSNYYIGYVMHQMTSYRSVDVDNNEILSNFDFKEEYKKAQSKLF